MIKDALFYSKILLFGEYGIIQDSMGLSVPYKAFRGELKFEAENPEAAEESNTHLKNYYAHLAQLKSNGELLAQLNLELFKADIDNGMFFDSTIPRGFGVGSSGALVAAIYDRYALHNIDDRENVSKNDLVNLKEQLGQMESYFHGKSSGIDPLICFLKLPILIKSKQDIGTVGIPDYSEGEGAIFLLNSGSPGETQPMVNIFMEKMKQEGFRNMIRNQFKKYNDACIKSFLKGDTKPLFSNLKELSNLILENFSPMIPSVFHQLWKQGLDSNAFYLKLCGSGGGGYILGFTQDLSKAREMLKDHNLEVIYRF
jgi:mevalonate kinase